MDWQEILGIVSVVLYILIILFCWFSKTEKNVYSIVAKLISLAEETGMNGSEKMEMVVNGLYAVVPIAFKKILNKTKLQEIAQVVFDYMKSYALDYLADKAKEAEKGKIEIERPSDFGKTEEDETPVGECSESDSCPIDFGE